MQPFFIRENSRGPNIPSVCALSGIAKMRTSARRQQIVQAISWPNRFDLGWAFPERCPPIGREYTYAVGSQYLGNPAAVAAKADDPHGGPVKVARGTADKLFTLLLAEKGGNATQQSQQECQRLFSDLVGEKARRGW